MICDLRSVIEVFVVFVLGEVVGAHINTTRPDKEDDLSKLLNDCIVDPKLYEANRDLQNYMTELNGFHIPIVAAEAQHSIMVYTYCKTPEDMKSYVKLLNSGRLQTVFENILNQLLKELEGENFQPLQAAVMLEEKDKMLIEEFTGLDGKYKDFKISYTFCFILKFISTIDNMAESLNLDLRLE